MMYPGNPTLSGAVKDRVVSTFQQTLLLYQQGRADEVAAGCNLILQMDPMFEPAKKLLEKTRNPALPIDVNALLPRDQRSPMQQARDAMAGRDFQRVIQLTSDILTDDLLNDDARVLGDEAREKMEAAPFVEQFTRKCDQLIASGNIAAAKMELEKARALDPTHPEILRIANGLAARDTAGRPAAASPSFIVDEKGAPPSGVGRSTAQAADFGFAFEEEKPAEASFSNFSFDTPAQNFSFDKSANAPADEPFGGGFSFGTPSAAPAPAPVKSPTTGEFDFATASVATTPDDQKKIDQYLADGDRAFEAADYQQAIELWSRIFLIDVTNDQASERIERAKAKRREIEAKVEEVLASGIAAFDRGDTSKAHADLTEALRLDPNNSTAQDYLDRLGETVVQGGASAREKAYIPPSVSDEKLDLGFFDDESPARSFEAPAVSPELSGVAVPPPPVAKRAAAPAPVKTTPERKVPIGLLAAVLGVLVLGGGGWFVWSRFMNKPEADFSATQQTISRATSLAESGKYDQAISLLKDIKPGDPLHDKALVLIADLNAKKSSAKQMIDGIPAAQYFDQNIAAARAAFDAHDFSGAKKAFEQAMRVKQLPPDAKAQYDAAAQQVAKLDAAKALFAERKFADAISNLQSLHEQDPQNQNIQRLIVDAHFNLGAQSLQEEKTQDAIREFDEVLKLTPDDELARRSRELALRYDGEPKDLLYRIYVKYLPLRQAT